MKLEIGKIFIKDIKFSDTTKVENGTLFVSKADLEKVISDDDYIKSVNFEIALPGEEVRITPVKDVIEPRGKVGDLEVFPGMVSKMATVGSGRTHVLKGMAVVTCGKIVGFQEGIIDMAGVGADYTPFSKLNNLCVVVEPIDGINSYDYEKSARMAGLKIAKFLGEIATEITPDEVETFETKPLFESVAQYPDLPKVAYVYMLQTQGLLHDTYVYGVDAKKIIPTILYPTEIMDGAILSGNCVSACDKNTTYHHLNNPVIEELYKRHGKDYNFLGVIVTNENVFLQDKERSSDMTAKLCKFLNLDGAIISQEGFGNPDTDLIMNCKKIEDEGIKTVIITDEYAGSDGMSQSLADSDLKANAVVTGGNANEIITLPHIEKVIGTLDYVNKIAGASAETLQPDGSLVVELQVITGATNELGFNCLTAIEI